MDSIRSTQQRFAAWQCDKAAQVTESANRNAVIALLVVALIVGVWLL